MTKGTRKELVKHLKLTKTQLNHHNSRGSKNHTGKTKYKLDGKGVVTKKLKISNVLKKTLKVAFNADKTRLYKRQIKFDREPNFLILVNDNIHEKVPGGAEMAG